MEEKFMLCGVVCGVERGQGGREEKNSKFVV